MEQSIVTRKLILPKLTASEAQALSTIAKHGLRVPVVGWKLSAQTPEIALSPYTGQALFDASQAHRIAVDWAGATLYLDVPVAAMQTWVSAALSGAAMGTLPQDWQKAALLHSCEWLAHTLTSAGRGKARVVDTAAFTPVRPTAARHSFFWSMHFDPQAELAHHVVHAVLHTDSLGLLLISGFIAALGRPAAVHDASHLPVPLQLCLGETDLPLKRLYALRRGDVVFLTRPFIQNQQQLYLRNESPKGPWWGISTRLEGTTLHILQAPQVMITSDPSLATSESDAGDAELSIDQIPIRLSFDVGSKVVSLQELQTMQPGQTLDLGRPLQEYVTVRANGVVVGTGQLVEIDGRLGVSIASLHMPAA